MSIISRRRLLWNAGATVVALRAFSARAESEDRSCVVREGEFSAESVESPFYEHYHQLAVPVAALLAPPAAGIVLSSSPVDEGSYDVEAFRKFIRESGLDQKALSRHRHEVAISREQLERIAAGEKDVEIRVISKNKNYVHNFLISAPPSVLARVRKKK